MTCSLQKIWTMKFIHPLFCFLMIVLFASCEEEKIDSELSHEVAYEKVDVVTGIQLRDQQGADIVVRGNPNEVRQGSAVYPNPYEDAFSIFSPQGVESIWVVPSVKNTFYDDSPTSLDSLLADYIYNIGDIEAVAVAGILTETDTTSFANVFAADLGVGFYRVFVEDTLGNVLSHNMYRVDDYEAASGDWAAFIDEIWPN